MVESRVPLAIDAIVTVLTAAGLKVWDGPVITDDYADAVYIGYDGDPEGEQRAAAVEQKWSGLGQRKRDEDSQIIGAVVVSTGDAGWKAARDKAYTMLGVVGQSLRADPSLGLSSPSIAELWPAGYYQEAGPSGLQARLVFAIHHQTRV